MLSTPYDTNHDRPNPIETIPIKTIPIKTTRPTALIEPFTFTSPEVVAAGTPGDAAAYQ